MIFQNSNDTNINNNNISKIIMILNDKIIMIIKIIK